MIWIAGVLVAVVAAQHLLFLALEMFFWTTPLGQKVFRTTPELARASAALAANQGLYNGFLAAGLIWALTAYGVVAGRPVLTFFLACVVVAGLYGGASVNRRIVLVQALPAAIALAVVWAVGRTAPDSIQYRGGSMERVVGIGGIFFKTQDPKKLKAWYVENLGFEMDENGYVTFPWQASGGSNPKARTVWGPFPMETKYYEPSTASFMVNYRVRNLDAMLAQLSARGIHGVGEPESGEFGRFAWVMDPEGNKIELWEPPPD